MAVCTFWLSPEAEPFLQQATITLRGDRYKTIALPMVGNKMIVAINSDFEMASMAGMEGSGSVRRGVIDIHGKPRVRSWTKVRGLGLASCTLLSA
jgi:hypothetical protein